MKPELRLIIGFSQTCMITCPTCYNYFLTVSLDWILFENNNNSRAASCKAGVFLQQVFTKQVESAKTLRLNQTSIEVNSVVTMVREG